ncbi:hypothetical protein L3Q82_003174 [Scortum barcoo]|uniref:Uncharacterized protein n=1 Tax=Scortum barcoo TaxID=214431 RepID=A0ACB8VRE4_9TELE|nr:hypothetical protein L3Q82_003174 [Scortum barcoo]
MLKTRGRDRRVEEPSNITVLITAAVVVLALIIIIIAVIGFIFYKKKKAHRPPPRVHILQRIHGCEWDDETREAVTTKLRWDADKVETKYIENYLTERFPAFLKQYLDFAKSSLLRTDLPSVSLLQKSPSSPVSCHATGFYPDRATLIWRKDGEELHEDVDHGEILPNHDGSFQMSVDLKLSSVTPEDWSRYDCVFHLSGVKDDIVTKLDKAEIRTNSGKPGVRSDGDRGPQFIAAFWKEFCQLLCATISLSSGYHPESNGQTERLNQELETCLKCLVAQNQTTWSQHLTWVEYAHNSLPTAATGLSPFQVVYGYQPPLFPTNETEVTVPSAHAMVKKCRKIWAAARRMLLRNQSRMKAAAGRHRRPAPAYRLGQKVWLSTKDLPLHVHSRKLAPRSLHVHPTLHVSKLKPFRDSPLVPPSKPPPPPRMVDGGPVYAVKKLLAHQTLLQMVLNNLQKIQPAPQDCSRSKEQLEEEGEVDSMRNQQH